MTVRVIKKYPNRRLYDTEISSYITIEDVRQLVVEGEEFEVRDARSGEDLTRCVRRQIIAEHEQAGDPVLSTHLLGNLIGNYLEHCMRQFMEQQQQLRQHAGGPAAQQPWTMMNQLAERNLEQWNEFQQELLGGLGRGTAHRVR